MDSVYLETSILSYLRSRPSSQVIVAARQLLTHQWWNDERLKYELVVSQYVIDEVSLGDPNLAADRLAAIQGVPVLAPDPLIPQIADEILRKAILPRKAQLDALHIAAAAHHRIQYLMTWNCKHIANAKVLPRIAKLLNGLSIPMPVVCTPEELLGDDPANTP
jgi:predicted nucleic acid-binding protein